MLRNYFRVGKKGDVFNRPDVGPTVEEEEEENRLNQLEPGGAPSWEVALEVDSPIPSWKWESVYRMWCTVLLKLPILTDTNRIWVPLILIDRVLRTQWIYWDTILATIQGDTQFSHSITIRIGFGRTNLEELDENVTKDERILLFRHLIAGELSTIRWTIESCEIYTNWEERGLFQQSPETKNWDKVFTQYCTVIVELPDTSIKNLVESFVNFIRKQVWIRQSGKIENNPTVKWPRSIQLKIGYKVGLEGLDSPYMTDPGPYYLPTTMEQSKSFFSDRMKNKFPELGYEFHTCTEK